MLGKHLNQILLPKHLANIFPQIFGENIYETFANVYLKCLPNMNQTYVKYLAKIYIFAYFVKYWLLFAVSTMKSLTNLR